MRVLVTGANRGIGKALIGAFIARGTDVTGTSRTGAAGSLALDVTDPASVRSMAQTFGKAPLDLLVCNAGIYPDRGEDLASGYPTEAWAEGFAVNVTGVFLTIQALLPNLLAARGKIVILSSAMASHTRAPGSSYIYRASKAAALNLGRNLATDLRGDGIAVGIYHPGWVRTEMGGSSAEIEPDIAARGLLSRFDALDLNSSGVFEDWQGHPIPF